MVLTVISLPIGHHTSLQKSVSNFTTGLLETTPTVPGLDPTIVISPRRLHMTLGVMALEDAEAGGAASDTPDAKTLPTALSLLSSLRPRILEALGGTRLQIPLQTMGIMPPDRGNPDKAHVLWLGSLDGDDARRLHQVGELVNRSFVDAGFVTDRRPLKLHCTILNTVYRRGTRGARQPFSYPAVLTSGATQAVLAPGARADWRAPVRVDFGTWRVDEIQICKMGSYGREGEYLRCGGLVLA